MAPGQVVPFQGPSSKEKKYDRQLRLWAASGQAALEKSHILLLNSGSGVIGVETLKNLVLPGIGQFTILDSATVEDADLGVNFFLEETSVGKSRAEETCRLLQELNPDVRGHSITEPIQKFIHDSSSLEPYTLILAAAPIDPKTLSKVATHARKNRIPLFRMHSIGFFASFSVALPYDFPIVDTHPDPATISDLRLLAPWKELATLASEKTADLDAMSDDDHGHVPYVLLLLRYIDKWKEEHDGLAPQNYKEKTDFREMVRNATRTKNAEGGEENFDEAVAAVLKALNPPTISSDVKAIFSAPECEVLTQDSPSFWLIASAISSFHKTHSVLPLPGSLPDMKARSADYIALQTLYKTKARADAAEVTKLVRTLEKDLERTTSQIPESEIETFCKNAAHIKLIRGQPIQIVEAAEESNDDALVAAAKMIDWGQQKTDLATSFMLPGSVLPVYLALLAWDIFTATHARAPGSDSSSSSYETDAIQLKSIATTLLATLLTPNPFLLDEDAETEVRTAVENAAGELARAGGAELHNTASVGGGIVAQEVIKVVTEQYVPADNVVVWDGVAGRLGVLKI